MGNNFNMQKSVASLYTNKELGKRKKKTHLQMHQKKKKYLGINLTKEAKDLDSENYKTLKK